MSAPAAYDGYEEEIQCRCCCAEHTFEDCPARAAGHCRGQHTMTRADYAEWKAFYAAHHGLDLDASIDEIYATRYGIDLLSPEPEDSSA